MPIYAYRCSSCGFQNDYLQKVSDPVLSTCPECGQATFAKQLTAAGFQLKGSGWYVTDFRNNGTKPAAKTNGDGKGDSKSESVTADSGKSEGGKSEGGKSEGGGESKPDTSSGTSSAAGGGTGASPACS